VLDKRLSCDVLLCLRWGAGRFVRFALPVGSPPHACATGPRHHCMHGLQRGLSAPLPHPSPSPSRLPPPMLTSVLPVARWGTAAKLATGRAGNPPCDSTRRKQRGGKRHTPEGVPSPPLHSAADGRSVRPSLEECVAAQYRPSFELRPPLLYVAAARCTEASGTLSDAPVWGAPRAGWET
jgi:hypothetical protein